MKKLIFPNYETKWYHNFIGMILSIITLTISFWVCYGYFFDRKTYFNRKVLLKYIVDNTLPDYNINRCGHRWFKKWDIGDYNITLDNNHSVYVFKGHKCVLSSFRSDFIDNRRYKKILDILLSV